MFEKSGKFYADWRDKSGKRLRKSFKSARAALQHEAAQKELAHPKPKAQGKQSPKSSAPDTLGGRSPHTLARRPTRSSPSPVPLHRTSSPLPTSRTLTKASGGAVIPIRRKLAAPAHSRPSSASSGRTTVRRS